MSILFISFEWLVCVIFFPCFGSKLGRLGLGGGDLESSPRLEATVGERNAPEVADCGGGLNCEYCAVTCMDKFGFRLACILENFFVAWFSMSNAEDLVS